MATRDDFSFDGADRFAPQMREAISQIRELRNNAREIATLALNHAIRLEQPKLSTLERDRAALALKLGQEDPRVRALDTRIESQRTIRESLDSLRARVDIRTPKSVPDRVVVYGRVVLGNRDFATGLQVVAIGENGRISGEDGTDRNGAYEIRIPVDVKAMRAVSGGEETAPPPSIELRLDVRDASGRVRHREADPVSLVPGASVYREIVIDDARPVTRPVGSSRGGDDTGASQPKATSARTSSPRGAKKGRK